MNTPDDLEQLGFGGSARPRYDLNLAGSAGIPTPDQLVQLSLWDGPPPADYGTPDFSVPMLNERPGDLDPDALDVMHASAQYEQIRAKKYPAVQMDQQGMNNRRSRKFTLLMKGLDSEEQAR